MRITMLCLYRLKTARVVFGLLVITCCCVLTARSQDLRARIDQYMIRRFTNRQSRVVLLVSRADEVIIRAEYGHSHHSSDKRKLARFPLGSIAEQFVSLAVLQLQERRKLRIDDSICSYLPSCPVSWRKIKILNLLTHTSGLPSINEASPGQNSSARPPDRLNRLIATVDDKSLEFMPGSKFKYNGFDLEILQFLLEKVSGRPWKEYIEVEIFRPLKMRHTNYFALGDLSTCLEKSDLYGTIIDPQDRDGEDVCSTVEDLYRWNRALMKKAIISSASLAQMLTPYRDGHSLGSKIIKEFDRRVAVQSGQTGEISVSVRFYPDDEASIVLACARSDIDCALLTHDIAAILFGRGYPASKAFLSTPTH